MSANIHPDAIERRKTARRSVRLLATAILASEANGNAEPAVIDCIIANISLGGMKIYLPEEVELPPFLVVEELQLGTRFECAVQWRHGNEAGLRFLSVSDAANLNVLIASGL